MFPQHQVKLEGGLRRFCLAHADLLRFEVDAGCGMLLPASANTARVCAACGRKCTKEAQMSKTQWKMSHGRGSCRLCVAQRMASIQAVAVAATAAVAATTAAMTATTAAAVAVPDEDPMVAAAIAESLALAEVCATKVENAPHSKHSVV